jgi:hypothetical protein
VTDVEDCHTDNTSHMGPKQGFGFYLRGFCFPLPKVPPTGDSLSIKARPLVAEDGGERPSLSTSFGAEPLVGSRLHQRVVLRSAHHQMGVGCNSPTCPPISRCGGIDVVP